MPRRGALHVRVRRARPQRTRFLLSGIGTVRAMRLPALRPGAAGRYAMMLRMQHSQHSDHVHVRVFMGPNADRLALVGVLMMDAGQWQLFGTTVTLGAIATHGRVRIESPDDRIVAE